MKFMEHLTGEIGFVYYQSTPGKWHVPREISDNIEEIEVIVSGRGYFDLADGSIVDAGPGSNLRYQPKDIVTVTSHENDPYETIVFEFRIKKPPAIVIPRYTQWQSVAECNRFCRSALALYKAQPEIAPEEVYCWYARLIEESRTYLRQLDQESLPEALTAAKDYIMEHFKEDISVKDIAQHARISEPHLYLLFRTHLKMSPVQFVIRQKLLLACELLIGGTLSVKEVCYRAGFNDVKYFISKFKAHTQLTPGQYSKRTRPNK